MDLNREYAAHQQALMSAEVAHSDSDRRACLARASDIAARIGAFQRRLGAAAACAWSASQLATTASA
ncbi:hypothetical protein [Altererythrobacter sp.]|uniref:hypothetical protein n=1 Tax=Altererythrobacter sp. TaxID=1872480 RepID=UPI003D01463E